MKLIMSLIIVLMVIMWHCQPMLMRNISAIMIDSIKRVIEIETIQKYIAKVKNGIRSVKDLISMR
ncbi:hypothetical protein [uncultured virus]|jgi:hypothetical protein|uniref:Uncharacterized protein n=1 Tax=uncultured virus TaxID=340016 RepID=A0A218MLQ9_9VIRU|nr:hypothetical protein [uncultured virus]